MKKIIFVQAMLASSMAILAIQPLAHAQTANEVLRQIQADINQQQRQPLRSDSIDRESKYCVIKQVGRSVPREANTDQTADASSTKAPAGKDVEINLRRINIEGVTLLDAKKVASIKLKYISENALLFETVDGIITDITQAYVDEGYVLARAYIPAPQDVTTGILTIRIIEVSTSAVEILENDEFRSGRDTAFPGLVGKPFNLRDFEQGIAQINRLQSKNAKIDILPTEENDKSLIRVCTDVSKPFSGFAEINNSGTRSTGETQFVARATFDDVLGLYDVWSFDVKHDLEPDDDVLGSRSISGSVSVPYGYWTATLSGSYYDYKTTIEDAIQPFQTSGSQLSLKAELDRVIHRDQNSVTSLSGSIEYKDIENFIAGSKLFLGSRALAIANVGLSRDGSFAGGAYAFTTGMSVGLDAFGALRDNNPAKNQPHAQFWSANFDLSYNRLLPVANQVLSWTSNLRGQWAPHALYSSEQFFIGGEGSVRGYRNGSLGGDVGVTWSNSLGYILPIDLSETPLNAVELIAGIDFGHIETNYADASQEGSIIGAQLGLRSRGGPLYFEATWNKGLEAPKGFQSDDDFGLFKVGGRI